MTIVVTGAAGYIGGQCALQLHDAGHIVIGIDCRSLPAHLKDIMKFVQADFDSDESYKTIIAARPDAIIHCAGTSLVGPSMTKPRNYYDNNFVKTKKLLDFMIDNNMTNTRLIFSSSAAVYGDPVMTPCSELDTPLPISPYGESKFMIESMLKSYHAAYGIDYVAFRYFNACGADPHARHGQEPGATHIIARVLESIRDKEHFTLYGDNYPTSDGTCIRDYIHVDDLATSHAMAIDPLVPAGVYNLGTSSGHSNQEIVTLAEKVTGQQVDLRKGPIRAGDPAVLTASADKFNSTTGWVPRYNIEEIITHVWKWYTR